jgi:hypothetical protein
MASSGIRIGAFDTLKWKDISSIIKNDEIIAAKLVVYAGDAEEYVAFYTYET